MTPVGLRLPQKPRRKTVSQTGTAATSTTWQEAQDFFLSEGGPEEDPNRLDQDGDGVACQSLPGAPEDDLGTFSLTDEMPPQRDDGFSDRNCGDFAAWQEAQDFFLSEGGQEDDPHRLDRNDNGIACESLPGAP